MTPPWAPLPSGCRSRPVQSRPASARLLSICPDGWGTGGHPIRTNKATRGRTCICLWVCTGAAFPEPPGLVPLDTPQRSAALEENPQVGQEELCPGG